MKIMMLNYFVQFIFSIYIIYAYDDNIETDPNGYILYCPCMGRFGNQVDHFLGSLNFAKSLNRTLALPPWIEYNHGQPKSIQIPFDRYFQIDPLLMYTKVITMEMFMKHIAPRVWIKPRIALCYKQRDPTKGCNAKEGNPFGPFWDYSGVDFDGSEFYGPLLYDVHHRNKPEQWTEKYLASEWPVLAFTGAPASFPVQKENVVLHKYLKWSADVDRRANQEVAKLPRGQVIGIHLRNGRDWIKACEHVVHSPLMFSSPQCLGYRGENGRANQDLCLPSKEIILRDLKRVVRKISAKVLFVASDNDHMIPFLTNALEKLKVSVHKMEEPEPHVELAVLGRLNYFIGNCVSSFSAFVKRERDSRGFPSSFWAYPIPKATKKHTEL